MGKRVRKPVAAEPVVAEKKKVKKEIKKVVKKAVKKPAKKVEKAVPKAKPKPTPKVRAAPAPKVKKEKKPKKVVNSGPKGYTADEYKKFQEEKARLQNLSNAELKKILKDNLQSMSGNKDDLVLKVADGIVLGRIPRCPSCFGGRPKYDYKTGVYTCPGYRDDEDYKNCHSTFNKQDLKRDPWQ